MQAPDSTEPYDVPPRPLIAFTCPGMPPTANNKLRPAGEQFLRNLEASFFALGSAPLSGQLYGVVYWFVLGYDVNLHSDADNISKKIWDRLEGVAYRDDKQVRLRVAGVRAVGPERSGEPELEEFDLSAVPPELVGEFERFLDRDAALPGRPSLTYVELGPLDQRMFTFNLAEGRKR